jgi:hypothetical protein
MVFPLLDGMQLIRERERERRGESGGRWWGTNPYPHHVIKTGADYVLLGGIAILLVSAYCCEGAVH